MTRTSNKATMLFPYLVTGTLVIVAVALFAVATIPYPALKTQLEALTLHGHADVFTEGFHGRLVSLLRAAAIVPLLAAAATFYFRRPIARIAIEARASMATFLVEIAQEATDSLRKDGRLHQVLLAVVLLLALLIRLLFLFQPIRYDEAYTYTHFASTPLYLTVSNYSSTNNHILNTLLVQFSSMLFGNHPWAIRLPALIAGWLLVPLTYVATRAFYNKHAALLAGALVASSSILILYSTNARGYTLMALFFMALVALAPYCLRSRNPAPWVLFSILTALGFYALPTMLYGFGIVATWLFLTVLLTTGKAARLASLKRLVVASLGGAALTVALYSPVLLVFGTNMRNKDVLPQQWQTVMTKLPVSILSAWQQWNIAVPDAVGVLLALGFVLALVFHPRISRHRVPLILAALIWIVPVVLIQRVAPYDRVWVFLLPLYSAMAAGGLAFLWERLASAVLRKRAGVAFGIAGLAIGLAVALNVAVTQSVYWSDDTGTLRDGEAIAVWMKDNLKQGDIVLAVTPADGPLEYYFPKIGLQAADYWYSTQLRDSRPGSGRRVLAVIQDAGPDMDAVLKKAGLAPADLASPDLIQRFPETSIYQLVDAKSQE